MQINFELHQTIKNQGSPNEQGFSRLHHLLCLPSTVAIYESALDNPDIEVDSRIQLPSLLSGTCQKRRHEFLAGRYCAVQALHNAGCQSVIDLNVGADGLPSWPPGWLGSISHCSVGAVAIATRDSTCRALSIDVEKWIDSQAAADIRSHVALPGELELLREYTTGQALTLLFSAKESLYKALYPLARKFFDFSAARLRAVSSKKFDLELCKPWSNDLLQGQLLEVQYAYYPTHVYTALHLSK